GDHSMSALSDDMIGSSLIWPKSVPPDEVTADQATTIARDAAAQSHLDIMTKGVTLNPMLYEELLTNHKHNSLRRSAHASKMRHCT
ncbi:MAG: hypothetical protein ACKPKO_19070, partial [Candidatus Fonsibacter sp.]